MNAEQQYLQQSLDVAASLVKNRLDINALFLKNVTVVKVKDLGEREVFVKVSINFNFTLSNCVTGWDHSIPLSTVYGIDADWLAQTFVDAFIKYMRAKVLT